MGNDIQCIRPSNEKISRIPPNRFKVRNVNESGHVVNKGFLEVNKTDLILHVRSGELVRWPLRCLRRYGYDANLFSFESGRRCATGPGIYAFKSKQASQIFRLIQESSQRPEENGTSSANGIGNSTTRQRSLSGDAALLQVSPPALTGTAASLSGSSASGLSGNLSPQPSLVSNLSQGPPPTSSPSPLYFNQNGCSLSSGSARMSPISPTIQYVNASAFGDIPESPLENVALPNGAVTGTVGSQMANRDSYGDPALNYARLKLPTDEDTDSGEDCQTGTSPADGDETQNAETNCLGKNPSEKSDSGESENGRESDGSDSASADQRERNPTGGGKTNVDQECWKEKGKKLQRGSEVKETNGGETGKSGALRMEAKDSSMDSDGCKDEESTESKASDDAMDGAVPSKDKTTLAESTLRGRRTRRSRADDADGAALLQDVVNGNVRPEKFRDRNGDIEPRCNILMSYANLTEQQIQDMLHKLESSRSDSISPCTVCSTSSSGTSQRVSPLSYYANLDTAGELPPNWQVNGFQFYPELRTPRSTSSKGSTTSEFTFEVNRGSCSPVDHNYENLDSLPEVQPLRHSLSSSAAGGVGSWMILQPPPKGKMNYIQLDFDENDQPIVNNVKPLRRSLSSSASSTPPKTPVSPQQEFVLGLSGAKGDIYARIDIEKTVALANSHRQVDGDTDISTRRTRHDVWMDNKCR